MRRALRRALPAVVLGAAGLLALPAVAADVTVRVGSYYFDDASPGDGRVLADQGSRITFRFEGDVPHTATVNGYFDSGDQSPGATYQTPTLTRAGTFTLFCQVHGGRHVATLVIRETAAPSPSPSTTRPSPSRTAAPSPSRSPSRSPSPRSTPTGATAGPAAGSPTASPRPTPTTATPTATPSPSSTSASPSAAAVVATASTVAPTDAPSPTPGSADSAPDLRPAVPLDDGGGWRLPAALVLFAVVLGGGAIALGKRRRIG